MQHIAHHLRITGLVVAVLALTRAGYGQWNQETKLTAVDAEAGDGFGQSVSLSGEWLVVGAQGDDTGKGSAYVFAWNGTSWVQQAKLTAADAAANDYFGTSVRIRPGSAKSSGIRI